MTGLKPSRPSAATSPPISEEEEDFINISSDVSSGEEDIMTPAGTPDDGNGIEVFTEASAKVDRLYQAALSSTISSASRNPHVTDHFKDTRPIPTAEELEATRASAEQRMRADLASSEVGEQKVKRILENASAGERLEALRKDYFRQTFAAMDAGETTGGKHEHLRTSSVRVAAGNDIEHRDCRRELTEQSKAAEAEKATLLEDYDELDVLTTRLVQERDITKNLLNKTVQGYVGLTTAALKGDDDLLKTRSKEDDKSPAGIHVYSPEIEYDSVLEAKVVQFKNDRAAEKLRARRDSKNVWNLVILSALLALFYLSGAAGG